LAEIACENIANYTLFPALIREKFFDYDLLGGGLSGFGLLLRFARNTILEDERVSAFRNFFISQSAESFSTVQSEGTNKLKSPM
jgi:hypothetical protein